jgi:hypothetical protein
MSCIGTACGLIVLEVQFFLKILVTMVAAEGICVCIFNDVSCRFFMFLWVTVVFVL